MSQNTIVQSAFKVKIKGKDTCPSKKKKKKRKDISVSQHFKLCRNDVDKPWPKVGVVNLFGNRNWCVAIAASNKNPMVYAATAGVFSFSHSAYRPLAFATRLDSH